MGDLKDPYDAKSTGVEMDPFNPPGPLSLAFRTNEGRSGAGVTREALRDRGLWEFDEEVGVGV